MRAESGIGSLLIFLATIVVAVVAAVVFITTATNLQQKAFAVGGEAKERVSATVDIESVVGMKNPTSRSVSNLTLVIRLAPGAEPIKLDEEGTTIQILTPEWQILSIRYNGTATGSAGNLTYPDLYNGPLEYGNFYVWVNQSVDRDGFWQILSPGELYTIVIPLDNNNYQIKEEMPVTIKIVSRTGISSVIKFRAPTVIKDPIVQLYP